MEYKLMSTTTRLRRRGSTTILCSVGAAIALVLTGCASDTESGAADTQAGSVPARLDPALYQKAIDEAKSIAGDQQLGGSIEFIGVNGGAEGDVLKGVYKAFTDATGTAVNYTGSQDIISIVQSRVQAGNPPDVVDQTIGVADQYAKQGKLMNLSEVVGQDALTKAFGKSLVDGVSNDGKAFGIYQGFNNFMVWYNPQTYKGPTDPKSWDELTAYTDQLAAQGTPAWCIAEEAGGASGFPGAQFIENLFAKKYGPELLRQWGTGELPWTSPQVKDAFEQFGAIATNDAAVSGGTAGALAAPIATGYNGLVADPSTCQLALWGAWVPGLIGESVKPTENLDFFRVPGFSNSYDDTEIFQSTVTTAFNDTPAIQAFMKYVASTQAQALLASADQWTVADTQVPASTYSSPLLTKSADTFFSTDGSVQLSTGPNVLATAAVQTAFYKGVVSYLQDPSSLDSVLQGIQAAAQPS